MDEGDRVFSGNESAALVVIEFPSFRDFIDAYSPIISEEGIFIRNADVSESNAFSVGDRVDFEVRLKDDFRLIQGAGEVVWLGESDAAGGAGGTAIRFHDVDEPSQRLISRLVGNYVRDGGKLFQIDEGKPVPDLGAKLEPLESSLRGTSPSSWRISCRRRATPSRTPLRFAGEPIDRRVGATGWIGRRGGRSAEHEQFAQHVHGIGDVRDPVVIRICCVLTGYRRRSRHEEP